MKRTYRKDNHAQISFDKSKSFSILVEDLYENTLEITVNRYFSKFGQVDSIRILPSRMNGRKSVVVKFSINCAFNQQKLLYYNHKINGADVQVREYPRNSLGKVSQTLQHPSKLFVGGLPPTLDNTGFKMYFEQFGAVAEAYIVTHPEYNTSRGFGFLVFEDPHSVTKVLERRNEHYIEGKWVKLGFYIRSTVNYMRARNLPNASLLKIKSKIGKSLFM